MTHTSTSPPPAHRFAVIGGDGRMTHLAEKLAEEGYPTRLLGCGGDCLPARGQPQDLRICTTLQKAAEDATALILPLPATRDGQRVHCPRDPACTVTFDELSALLSRHPQMILFGGNLPADFCQAHPHTVDYYQDPVLQLRNAHITAEAALMTAMELTDCTIRDTAVAVLGFGQIGKYLARLLHSLGARVTVCARRDESLFEAVAEGCTPLRIIPDAPQNGLQALRQNHTILFNTIPSPILPRELLTELEPDTLLIDLASAPFGVSDSDVQDAATKNGLRYLRAPSLPGSYAPRDAGRAIASCILDTLTRANLNPTEGGKQA